LTIEHVTKESGAKVQIREEQDAWDKIVSEVLGPEAELTSVSRFNGDSRVYVAGSRAAKIRSKRSPQPEGVNRLADEARMLADLGQDVQFNEDDEWESLLVERRPGASLEQQLPTTGMLKRIRILLKIIPLLNKLHKSGFSHGDLIPDNILVTDSGEIDLIDYDRALRASALRSRLRDWLGFNGRDFAPNPYWNLIIATIAPKSQTLARRVRTRLKGAMPVTRCQLTSPDLETLHAAWKLAQTASANAPGQSLAYYAFTYKDCHFIGERPWYLRWDAIRRSVNFDNKKVLELGCNMGLLSTFAKLHGAQSALGVDADPVIVQSARLVADALQSGARFEPLDLMGDINWEADLKGHDLVIAMSLVHWLPNKERVLRFLGEHSELIYEGHDPLSVETDRLRSIGFDEVSVIARTERDRYVLHARRAR
jgi:tRNA A-37 threonylcarbamoyl transferase component Bud32/2-polyprenyl-3-methyl-5-hydroxy-6-metoxy-1,4-benzoquinol methylase